MGQLDGKTIAFVATHGVEQVELTEPWKGVDDEGAEPVLPSIEEDLPAFCAKIVEEFAEGRHAE
jgi:hypothetical protein